MMRTTLVRRTTILLLLGILVFGACGLATLGIRSRDTQLREVREWTKTHAATYVKTVTPKPGWGKQTIDVPGQLAAYNHATIYSRVSGYVAAWNTDIGTEVQAGQVLAQIDAPELDQQLLHARAELLSVRASANLSETTYRRRQSLLASQVVSQQELDERLADLERRKAAVAASEADVNRIEALTKYKTISAPFSGIITSRNIDLGNLIEAGGRNGAALFSISDMTRMRIYIDVPQVYASLIELGAAATFTTPSEPLHIHTAIVDSMSRAVNASTGTTRMQLILDNPDRRLMPGGYVTVHVALSGPSDALSIPASALIINRDGTQVATLTAASRVSLRKVRIVRDLGREILIASDLSARDRLLLTPPDGIVEGEMVRDATTTQDARAE